jgi:hypothetical protein
MAEAIELRPRDYKSGIKPIWCPGCGHYSVLNAITKAAAACGLAKDDTVLVSGIGCSSRLPAYVDSYGFHGVHGRGLAVAQGLKVARPDLTVIALGGDGDGFSIGGNHFMHACRRNVNMTYIAMDNEVYGMTKGQASPTTPMDWTHSKLTPHGTGMRPFKPAAWRSPPARRGSRGPTPAIPTRSPGCSPRRSRFPASASCTYCRSASPSVRNRPTGRRSFTSARRRRRPTRLRDWAPVPRRTRELARRHARGPGR